MNQDTEETGQTNLKDENAIKEVAYADTQLLMKAMTALVEEYIEKGTQLNHNTKFLVASRAVAGLHWSWTNHIAREFNRHLATLSNDESYTN